VTLSRIEELQRALDMEREARLRSEAAADSLARRAELVEARVDSLAARDEATTGAESRESALRSELQSLLGVLDVVQDVGQTARGIEVRIGGAFPSGGMVLEGAARGQVQRVARVLVGAEAQARAEAVRDVLVGAGIPSSAISVLASGETSPIAGNDTPEGRARNRRVEIVVTRP
jgi:flagellar motor protein MotB